MPAKGVRIKVSSDAARQILSSDEVRDDLETRVDAITDAAGGAPDFDGSVEVVGGSSKLGRVMGYITTVTHEARRAEAEDGVLLRALDAGR